MKSVERLMMVWVLAFMLTIGAKAQIYQGDYHIEPTYISVSDNMTTNLIFPYSIRSVDKGSIDLLVQKATNAENVLQVKAASPKLTETNLTVITSSGMLYSFITSYSTFPSVLNFTLDERNYPTTPMVQLESGAGNEGALQQRAKLVAAKDKSFIGKRDRKYKVGVELKSLYMQGDNFYFQLQLTNNSNVSYTVDQFRLYIMDKKTAKRTAAQEIELEPLQVMGDISYVPSRSSQRVVLVMKKFGIPDKKLFHIQLMEKDGGRHLELKLKNRDLLKGKGL